MKSKKKYIFIKFHHCQPWKQPANPSATVNKTDNKFPQKINIFLSLKSQIALRRTRQHANDRMALSVLHKFVKLERFF